MRWWTAALCLAAGCASAEEKCEEATTVATASWTAYRDAVKADLEAAENKSRSIQTALRERVMPRMNELAEKEADKRHNRSTPEWLRAYEAHAKAICTADNECKQLKMDRTEVTAQIEELGTFSKSADAILAELAKDLEAARDAGKDLPDFERDAIRTARTDTDAALETCAEVD